MAMATHDDAALIALARSGDNAAIASLYERHFEAGASLAVALAGSDDAPDLAAEAFARIVSRLHDGGGPESAFRPYLLASVRNLYVDSVRRSGREVLVESIAGSDLEPHEDDPNEARIERQTVASAYNSLPERWQAVLWYTTVADESNQTVADHLGINPNAVAALNYRAREGLRQAYLAEHMSGSTPECRAMAEPLARLVRGKSPKREKLVIASHLHSCAACRRALHDLRLMNSTLAAVLVPALLGVSFSRDGLARLIPGGGWSAKAIGVVAASTVAAGALVLGALYLGGDGDAAARESRTVATSTSSTSSVGVADGGRPQAEPSPTPTQAPSKSATPTAQPSRSASAQPTRPTRSVPPPSPSQSPTAVVSPSPTLSPTPSAKVVADVGIGRPHQKLLPTADRWSHLELPVRAKGGDLRMTVELTGVGQFNVHRDAEFGAWTCTGQSAADATTLRCELPGTGANDAASDFAIDVLTEESVGANVRLSLAVVDGVDPRPGDNSASVEIR